MIAVFSNELPFSQIHVHTHSCHPELDEKVTDSGLSAREGAGIGIGVMGMAVMLILVITISLVFFVKFLHQKSVSSRIQKLQQKNVLIAAVNTLFLTVDVNSPGTPPSGYIEFPRKKLKLHQEIGKVWISNFVARDYQS